MSETITLGKNRKSGKWEVLVQPEKPFGDHLDSYRKIAVNAPVNDDYERVVIGRVTYTSPPLVLMTAEQRKKTQDQTAAHLARVGDAVEDAQKRQALRDLEIQKQREAEHAEQINAKNALVNSVRSETRQPLIKESKKTETVAATAA